MIRTRTFDSKQTDFLPACVSQAKQNQKKQRYKENPPFPSSPLPNGTRAQHQHASINVYAPSVAHHSQPGLFEQGHRRLGPRERTWGVGSCYPMMYIFDPNSTTPPSLPPASSKKDGRGNSPQNLHPALIVPHLNTNPSIKKKKRLPPRGREKRNLRFFKPPGGGGGGECESHFWILYLC